MVISRLLCLDRCVNQMQSKNGTFTLLRPLHLNSGDFAESVTLITVASVEHEVGFKHYIKRGDPSLILRAQAWVLHDNPNALNVAVNSGSG